MGKVNCVPGHPCCHVFHHNFQFGALICFYFTCVFPRWMFTCPLFLLCSAKISSWMGSEELKNYGVGMTEGRQCQRSCWYPPLSGEENFAKSCELLHKNAGSCTSYLFCEFGGRMNLQAKEGVKELKITQWPKYYVSTWFLWRSVRKT